MEDFNETEMEFAPEFSEFNPIFAELKEIKEYAQSAEDTGIVALAIRNLMPCRSIINS